MNNILLEGNQYFSEKLKIYGPTPKGVDWNSEPSQILRFQEFAKLLPLKGTKFTFCDFGCGYGAFLEFIRDKNPELVYTGYDINEDMIKSAQEMFKTFNLSPNWTTSLVQGQQFEYTMACGVLNLKLHATDNEWIDHVKFTLHELNSITSNTFAFNILTSYSDPDKKKDYLYYADPCFWFDYCIKNFSKNVSLRHDYGAYEFIIQVKK